jgi:hypothetical protein
MCRCGCVLVRRTRASRHRKQRLQKALDWTSTGECLLRPWHQGHEGELLSALVKNNAGSATLRVGASALSILAEYKMTRPGHSGWLGWANINVGLVGHTDMARRYGRRLRAPSR